MVMETIQHAGARDAANSVLDDTQIELSVVVLVSERPEPLVDYYHEYAAPLREAGIAFEFLFVAEPWLAAMTEPLRGLVERGEPVRVLHLGQGAGETLLLRAAAAYCRGETVLTLPAYRRIHASDLLTLVRRMEGADSPDLVVARRWPRSDSWVNRFQNRIFHWFVGRIAGGRIHDVACGVRVMSRETLQKIPLYGDFSRFLPLLALRDGYRVAEVDTPQHEGDIRARIYHPGVYLRRLMDVLNLFFLLRFTDKPLRFFGLPGSIAIVTGAGILCVIAIQRLQGHGIADRPLLLLGVLLLVLGVQAVALGLIGEIIVHLHADGHRPYRVARDTSMGDGPPASDR